VLDVFFPPGYGVVGEPFARGVDGVEVVVGYSDVVVGEIGVFRVRGGGGSVMVG